MQAKYEMQEARYAAVTLGDAARLIDIGALRGGDAKRRELCREWYRRESVAQKLDDSPAPPR